MSPLLGLCHELSRESVTYVIAQSVTYLYALYTAVRPYRAYSNDVARNYVLNRRTRHHCLVSVVLA